MNRMPRFLPILVVAVGGVLAARAATGAAGLPDLLVGARAWAEEAAPGAAKDAKTDAKDAKDKAGVLPPGITVAPPPKTAAPVCAPTAAELARQAGLSPAELQVLQSLGTRRGQLDQREKDMDVQLALLAAAEAKLDAKLKTLGGLKTDIQGLLGQAEAQKQAEQDRLVRVYENMKPKDAAARMTILSDEVRLPIAAKMKERALSAILGQMPPVAAKILTEKLSNRMAAAEAARQALAGASAAPVAAAPAKPTPAARAQARSPAPKPQAKAPAAAKPQSVAEGPAPAAAPAAPSPPPAPAAPKAG